MVVSATTGEDWPVVEPVEVWMVHLGAGSKPREIRGTLTLGDRSLEFVERKTGVDVRFDYDSIRRAKRIKGSPVLLVDSRTTRSVHARDAVETTGRAHEPRLHAILERHDQAHRAGVGGGGDGASRTGRLAVGEDRRVLAASRFVELDRPGA